MSNVSVAVVGCGIISENHLRGWGACGVRVVAVVDIEAKRAQQTASRYGVESWCESWRDVLDREDVSVVDICTPPEFHAEIAKAALVSGKHVVCEKPLAPTLAQCDEMIEISKTAERSLLPVHQLRASAMGTTLRRFVIGQRIGEVVFGHVLRFDPPPAKLVSAGRWGRWSGDGGGVLMTKAIHQLDLLLWLLGPVRRVHAMMDTRICSIESEDQLAANIEFESGAQVSLVVSGAPWARRQEFELIGTKGRVSWPGECELADGTFQILGGGRAAPQPPRRSLAGRVIGKVGRTVASRAARSPKDNDHGRFFQQFIDAQKMRGSHPATSEDGRLAVELCTAIYESAITNHVVELPLRTDSSFYRGVTSDAYKGGFHAKP